VTVWPLAAESVAVKTALVVAMLPSGTVTSSIETLGAASSSLIVPTPSPSAMVALIGAVRLTVKVSSASESVSPTTSTVTVFEVSPVRNVSVPLAAA
jgi:hypothetical protein